MSSKRMVRSVSPTIDDYDSSFDDFENQNEPVQMPNKTKPVTKTPISNTSKYIHSTPFAPIQMSHGTQLNCEESIIEKSVNAMFQFPTPAPKQMGPKKVESPSYSSDPDESFQSAVSHAPTAADEIANLVEKSLKIASEEDNDSETISAPKKMLKVKYKRQVIHSESESEDSVVAESESETTQALGDSESEKEVVSDLSPDSESEDELSPEELEDLGARTGAVPKPKVPIKTNGAIPTPKFAVPTSKIISKLLEIIESTPDPQEDVEVQIPKSLRVELYAHQCYGLRWLWWREHQIPGGGILADEMGLGKTVMMLSLICKGLAEGTPVYKNMDKYLNQSSRLIPSRATLIIVPPSVIGQWETEITKKTKRVQVLMFHGPNRIRSASILSRYDIVLTTYKTVQSEMPKGEESGSCLAKILWDRLVLDEGHTIRNETTSTASACCFLNAKHRWIVTGTPVHNKPSDMFSLIKFLRLVPFNDPKTWSEWIGMKIVKSLAGAERLNTIGKALLLRRTKDQVKEASGADSIQKHAQLPSIPEKTIEEVHVELTVEERRIYNVLHFQAQEFLTNFLQDQESREMEKQYAADNYVPKKRGVKLGNDEEEGSKNKFAQALAFLCRLRQFTVLPFLVSAMVDDDPESEYNPDLSLSKQLDEDLINLDNPIFSESYESSKIKRLLQDLKKLKADAVAEKRPMDKVIVLSQWTSLLNIIGSHLSRNGFSHVNITGQVKISERASIVENFNTNPNRPQIMLLALMAGGVGLNLTGANVMYVMDIHWNPQIELQAHDRIHRFGQKKEVKIYRLLSEKTIDVKMYKLQSNKKMMADALLNSAKTSKGQGLTLQDMKKLFEF